MSVMAVHQPVLTVPINDHDHIIGSHDATMTLVEYGDYQCPYCGAAHPSVKEVLRVLGDDLLFAFRHFPLSQIHQYAFQAAEAAEAAGAQDRFWQMHDLLFTHQDRLATPDLIGYAGALGLDVQRFVSDLESHRHAERIREHFMSGVRSGVNGTPTFFVNGIRHNGSYDPDSLLEALGAVPAASY
jgi:protein-disulfide isomerase